MKILLLFFFRACVAALLGVGLFQVLQEWLRYPTYRATHMMRPKQLTAANFSLVICVIVMYMAVVGMQIFDSFHVMM